MAPIVPRKSHLSAWLWPRAKELKRASQIHGLLVGVKNMYIPDAPPIVDERIACITEYIAENCGFLELAMCMLANEDDQHVDKDADLKFCTQLVICAVATGGCIQTSGDNKAALEAAENLFRL